MKNHHSKTAKALRGINAKRRLLLTGTPIQNNLKELWALFDYICEGDLLGPLKVGMIHTSLSVNLLILSS